MSQQRKYSIAKVPFMVIALIIAQSCAQITTPQGGPPDETAPRLDTVESTPNRQTNFKDRKIELVFDEWIKLTNPIKEVFISPPLSYPPQIKSHGKKVTVEFSENEVLQDSTTYQIAFGKAIKDLTADNVVENFVFLFATGDKIDTLSLGGKVVDSTNGQAAKDVIVMLYNDLSDTCFTTTKPLYMTRTTEDGSFKLEKLRADTFQIFGLLDGNVSYTYDVQTEQVAFLDSFLILKDTLNQDLKLELFDEVDEPIMIEAKQKKRGLITMIYQPALVDPQVEYLTDKTIKTFVEQKGDTIHLWHTDLAADSTFVVVNYAEVRDTIKIKTSKDSISRRQLKSLTNSVELLAKDTINIEWNKPLELVVDSLMSLSDTSGVVEILESGQVGKTLWLTASMRASQAYTLTIDSAAVGDWYGAFNKDSLLIAIETYDPEAFGQIALDVIKSDSLDYILELLMDNEVIKTFNLSQAGPLIINTLVPGQYKLKLTQDLNGDGQWTAGIVKEKKRPELIKELTLEELKAGWDLEAKVDIQELFYGASSK